MAFVFLFVVMMGLSAAPQPIIDAAKAECDAVPGAVFNLRELGAVKTPFGTDKALEVACVIRLETGTPGEKPDQESAPEVTTKGGFKA